MQYSVASSYSGPASRVRIKRLIIRRMNNSPCNLTEVEDRSTRKKKAEGRLPRRREERGATISCSVTRQCEKLTASPTSFRSFSRMSRHSFCHSCEVLFLFYFLSISISLCLFFISAMRQMHVCFHEMRNLSYDSGRKKHQRRKLEIKMRHLRNVLTDGNILRNIFFCYQIKYNLRYIS